VIDPRKTLNLKLAVSIPPLWNFGGVELAVLAPNPGKFFICLYRKN